LRKGAGLWLILEDTEIILIEKVNPPCGYAVVFSVSVMMLVLHMNSNFDLALLIVQRIRPDVVAKDDGVFFVSDCVGKCRDFSFLL